MSQSSKNSNTGIYGDAFVYFKNGRQIKIKHVVENGLAGEILTLNEETILFEYKKIINGYKIGVVKNNADLLNIQTEGLGAYDGSKNGISITLTPTHKVLTKHGWLQASLLSPNDSLVAFYKSIQGEMRDILYAMTAGDSHLNSDSKNSKNTARLILNDSQDTEYPKWKIDKLSPAITFRKNSMGWISEYTHDFKLLKDEVNSFKNISGRTGRNPIPFLDYHFTKLGLAIWIMDDGHLDKSNRYSLSIGRFANYKPVLRTASRLLIKFGYEHKIGVDGNLQFTKKASTQIAKDIYQYVPKCMERKLPEDLRNKYEEFDLEFSFNLLPEYIKVISKREASNRQMNKLKGIYALEIEGSNNYMAGNQPNGVIVKAGV